MTDVLHAGLDLLDRQIVDRDGELVGKVDDLELTDPEDGPPRLVALLTGAQAYGTRLGGRLGGWIVSAAGRLGGTKQPVRIPFELVEKVGPSIRLSAAVSELERVERVDHWLRDNFIGRIPGAGNAPE
jgi:sporulation protein YlmC with PRC-barrel domain